MEVLTHAQLKKLEKHKYSSTGTSLVEPIFQVYWRWLVEYVPLWLAPNAITIIGLFFNLVTSFTMVWYSPHATEVAPKWVHWLNVFGLFIYQSLDAIDGKQARRTNSSTPLGELFDHGCDSISTVVVSIAFSCSLLLGKTPEMMFFVCVTAFFTFYCGHWVSYVTGQLQFGLIDVTEAQLSTMGLFLVSGLFGSEIWEQPLPLLSIELKYLPLFFLSSGCVLTILKFGHVIIKGGCGPNGSTVAGTSVISPFLNIIIVIGFAITIAKKSSIEILSNHPCLYLLFFGIIAGKVTNRLVVAHMTKSELQIFDTALLGPLLLFLNQYFNSFVNEYFLVWVCLIHATIDLLQYLTYTYQQIAQHLGIKVFTIPYPQEDKKAAPNNAPKRK